MGKGNKKWLINAWKTVQHPSLSGKCNQNYLELSRYPVRIAVVKETDRNSSKEVWTHRALTHTTGV